MIRREIYYIIFNKHIRGDRFEADSYQLEVASAVDGKIPEKIIIKDGKITVTFTDGVRHIFNYDEKVEYFDRPIKPKTDADKT